MSKTFWAIIAALIIIFGGIAVINSNKNQDNTSSSSSATTHHVQGDASSGVTLVEYGDYQCPYCEEYYQTVKGVVAQYQDKIQFQFVNFPLTSIHQNAFAAARAAEAAGKQGKYWEMHDTLYENNDATGGSGWISSTSPTTYFNKFAQDIGLNVDKFKKDYASSAVNAAITADMNKGNKLGITGTPTFYVNGKQTTIANDAAAFQKVLDAAIKAKSSKS